MEPTKSLHDVASLCYFRLDSSTSESWEGVPRMILRNDLCSTILHKRVMPVGLVLRQVRYDSMDDFLCTGFIVGAFLLLLR